MVRDQLGARRCDDRIVAARMVVVRMGVQDLGNLPSARLCRREAFFVVQRIDRKRLAAVRAGDQVVEVAIGIAGPDALDDHVVDLLGKLDFDCTKWPTLRVLVY